MKAVLSSLLCFVFLQTQVWALHGGPAGAGSTNIVGTYAGVLIPTKQTVYYSNTAFNANSDFKNALGIFLVAVPDTGATNGNFLLFDSGEAFTGTIIGITDPRTLEFKGVVSGPDLANPTGSEFLSPVDAVGSIDAFVQAASATTQVSVATALTGKAHIDEQGFAPDSSPDGVGFTILKTLEMTVDGFQQSTTAGTVTIPAPNISTVPQPSATP